LNPQDPDEYMRVVQLHEDRIRNNQAQLRSRRDELVESIKQAFNAVTRKGGVSLAETEPLDAGATERACLRIRAQQRDKHWSEVDLREHDPYGSGICFLDPIGFKYHAPAYMIDALTVGNARLDDCEHDEWMGQDTILYRLSDLSDKEFFQLFDIQQRACVARFLAFHIELNYTTGNDDVLSALSDYWASDLPDEEKAHLTAIWPDAFS